MTPGTGRLPHALLRELESELAAIDPDLSPERAVIRAAALLTEVARERSPRLNLLLVAAQALAAVGALDRAAPARTAAPPHHHPAVPPPRPQHRTADRNSPGRT